MVKKVDFIPQVFIEENGVAKNPAINKVIHAIICSRVKKRVFTGLCAAL